MMNRSVVHRLRRLGPYVLIELLLPGGTLIALLLWLTHHGGSFRNVAVLTPSTVPSVTAPAATGNRWVLGARPRTLPAAVAPVLVGTALAGSEDVFKPLRFACALIGSIFIQIGTNLANDYSDAKRGADTADRLGPVRVTSAGLVTPQRVMTARDHRDDVPAGPGAGWLSPRWRRRPWWPRRWRWPRPATTAPPPTTAPPTTAPPTDV